jgi:hypothetical protein
MASAVTPSKHKASERALAAWDPPGGFCRLDVQSVVPSSTFCRVYKKGSLLGASLSGEKRYAESEPLLLEGYRGMDGRKGRIAIPDQYHLELARMWIVQLYQAWGKPEKAADWTKN